MPTIIGSGRYSAERAILTEYPNRFNMHKRNKYIERIAYEDVGGSCANILCVLANKGWTAIPQAMFYDCTDGFRLESRLQYYGCDTQHVQLSHEGSLVSNYIRYEYDSKTGKPVIKHNLFGLFGTDNSWRQLKVGEEVDTFLCHINDVPDIYYYDVDAEGNRCIADRLRKQGSIVIFLHLNKDSITHHGNAVNVSDIIVFHSNYKIDSKFCYRYQDKLFIQFLESDGVNFKLGTCDWVHMPSIDTEGIIDWDGYNDIAAALFIRALYRNGSPSVQKLSIDDVQDALMYAIRRASKYSEYMNCKGWLEVW